MKTQSPTTYDLPALVFHDTAPGDGAPRVLVQLPKDGGRVVVVIHEPGNVVVRSLSTDEDPDTGGAAPVCEYREGGRFEAFTVNGVPYRFNWYTHPDGGSGEYIDRLDVTSGARLYTDAAAKKIRETCAAVVEWLRGQRPGLFHIAEAANIRRAIDRRDSELAELAEQIGAKLEERAGLVRKLIESDGDHDRPQLEELPRVSFEEGRAVLSLGDVEATLAERGDVVRLGLDFEAEGVPLALRVGEHEGADAWQALGVGLPR